MPRMVQMVVVLMVSLMVAEAASQITGTNAVLVVGGTKEEPGEGRSELPVTSFLFPAVPGCSIPSFLDSCFSGQHHIFVTPSGRLAICGCGEDKMCLVLKDGRWRADPQPGAWTWSLSRAWAWARRQELLPHLPRSILSASVVSLPQGVLVLGGWEDFRNDHSTTSLLLPAGGSSWEEGPTIPGEGVIESCTVVWRGNVLVIGGRGRMLGGNEVCGYEEVCNYNQMRELNTTTWQWEEESKWPQLPGRGRGRHACTIINSKLIVSGGKFRSDEEHNWRQEEWTPTLILDLSVGAEAAWVEGARLNTVRYRHSMVTVGAVGQEKVYALGGSGENHEVLDSVEVWQEDSKTWVLEEERMQDKRRTFGALAVDKASYCT